MHLSVQLFAATAGWNQLNTGLSGWRFGTGSRQRLLQKVARKVTTCNRWESVWRIASDELRGLREEFGEE